MFIATDTQAQSKLRQERHGQAAKWGGRRRFRCNAAPDRACFGKNGSGYKHGAPSGADRGAGEQLLVKPGAPAPLVDITAHAA